MDQDDDAELIRASIEDPARFETIFDRHHQRIWRYLARLGGREIADELAGDVFLVAFTRRASYDPARAAVAAWLYGIASNRFRTRSRSQRRAGHAFRRAAAQHLPPASPTDDLVDAMADQQQLTRVVDAMARLPAGDREVIVLYAWERLPYEAIAAVLGVELGTVRSRLARARCRLRELAGLSGEVSEESDFAPTPERTPSDG